MKRGGPLSRRTELRTLTPLQRSKPMPRTGGRPRTPGTSSPATSSSRRPARATGPSVAVRRLVLDRADGCCEVCGTRLHDGAAWLADHSFHHRRPRRMGGTTDPAVNRPTNLLLLCGTGTTCCHGLVESQRALATSNGWILTATQDPIEVPVELAVTPPGHRTWLTDDAGISIADATSRWRLR